MTAALKLCLTCRVWATKCARPILLNSRCHYGVFVYFLQLRLDLTVRPNTSGNSNSVMSILVVIWACESKFESEQLYCRSFWPAVF